MVMAVLATTTTLAVWYSYEWRLDRVATLANAAMGLEAATDEVRELGRFHGTNATNALINIALETQAWPSNRVTAIQELVRRDDEAAEHLVWLVHPDQGPDVSLAAIDAIAVMNCSRACVHDLLKFKYLMWRGEFSSTYVLFRTTADGQEYERRINLRVNKVLLAHSELTSTILREAFAQRTELDFAQALKSDLRLVER